MSSGPFEIKSYAASYSATANHPILVQPETLELSFGVNSNGDAIGAINNPISAVISRGKRAKGLRPRTVTFRWDEGEAPEGYEERATVTLPWLQRTGFDSIVRGTVGTYLGGTGKCVGTSPEVAQ